MIPRDDQSWEDAQLAIIAQDPYLLDSFQTLKYVNGKYLILLYLDECSLLTLNLHSRSVGSALQISCEKLETHHILDRSTL